MMRCSELLDKAGLRFERNRLKDFRVKSVTCHSRLCRSGSLFAAWKGTCSDGHRFIGEARRRGADLVLAEDRATRYGKTPVIKVDGLRRAYALCNHILWGGPSERLNMYGITGTNGKTTCAYLAEAMMSPYGKTAVLGTVEYRWGRHREKSRQTTPDPEVLQPLLARAVRAGCRNAVIEASSHALEQERLAGCVFDAALFTNFTQDHLDYHGSMRRYLAAKKRLLGLIKPAGIAVINGDDPAFCGFSKTGGRRMSFGLGRHCDLRAEIRRMGIEGSEFLVRFRSRRALFHSPLVGRHNIYNVLGAAALAVCCGVSLRACSRAVRAFAGTPGRLERVKEAAGFDCFVDYAHTEDGLRSVLEALRPFVQGKLLLLFGCGGDRDRAKRPRMGRVAADLADHVTVTSDNPRTEDPPAIAGEIVAGFPQGFGRFEVRLDRREAIGRVLRAARRGDVVLIAGKGHEDFQILGSRKIRLDDRRECLRVIRTLRARR